MSGLSRLLPISLAALGGCLTLLPVAKAEVLSDLNRIIQLQANRPTTNPSTSDISQAREQAIASNPNIFYAADGPWGKLRCLFIYLEAPQTLVDAFPLPSTRPSWNVPSAQIEAFAKVVRESGVEPALADTLLKGSDSAPNSEGLITLFPAPTDLEAIPPKARTQIYSKLAEFFGNEFHTDPVLIIGQSPSEWFRSSKLRPELVAKISQLSYMRGETTAFSDISLLLNYASSESEARLIFKSLTRTRALMVKLEVPASADVQSLVNYWSLGLGLRRKDVEPLLQSIRETNGLESLPLSHLLPSLARKLIYTYPSMDMNRHGTLPDCHWTCLNFFNYEPHEYLLDSRLATSAVLERFTPVEPPYTYGDILFFLSKDTGDAYHSCIYLADNLVYTKNGRNLLAPWLIMRREDVEKIYLYKGDGRVQAYRLKRPQSPNQ